MVENSRISWTDHTFNGWIGCTKISEACQFCYAERDWDHRFHRVIWGPKGARSLTSDTTWREPLRWDAEAKRLGIRYRVFANSLSDVFDDHPSIEPAWRGRLWRLIDGTPNLDWLLLTKRPENWHRFLPSINPESFPNIRLGISIENQERADERARQLVEYAGIGWPTFVSYEPACGPVDWEPLLNDQAIGWLIAGGESGPKARPSHPDWFRVARDACARHAVPFHFKQWGEWWEADSDARDEEGHHIQVETDSLVAREMFDPKIDCLVAPDGKVFHRPGSIPPGIPCRLMTRLGRKVAGRTLDGIEHDAFPVAA